MIDKCKFMIEIKGERLFQCAASATGWAYLWSLEDDEDYRRPCPCEKFKKGKPKIVDKELNSAEFWRIAGEMITARDWEWFRQMRKENR